MGINYLKQFLLVLVPKDNEYFHLVTLGRQLRLDYEDNYYYMIITEIDPSISNNTIEYSIKCQDIFSYFLSRNNINASFADEEDATSFKFTGKNIGELSREVVQLSNLTDWQIDPALELEELKSFPSTWYDITNHRIAATSTLNLDTSNTFNALVEIATLFNAEIVVEYPKDPNEIKTIYFKNKEYPFNSYTTFEQNVNLSDLQVGYQIEDFCSVLHVIGAEDGEGNQVSLTTEIPISRRKTISTELAKPSTEQRIFVNNLYGNYWNSIDQSKYIGIRNLGGAATTTEESTFESMLKKVPALGSALYDFSYFEESHLLNPVLKKSLMTKLTGEYFDANLRIQMYAEQYYNILRRYQQTLNLEEEYISLIAAENQILCDLTGENELDAQISVPVVSTDPNKDTSSEDGIDSSSTMKTMTKQEESESKIEDLTQKLWNVWTDTQGEHNYSECHASYIGGDFIYQRIKEYFSKIHTSITEFKDNESKISEIFSKYNISYTAREIVKYSGFKLCDPEDLNKTDDSYYIVYDKDAIKDFDSAALALSKESDADYGNIANLRAKQKKIINNLGYVIVYEKDEDGNQPDSDYFSGYFNAYIEVMNSLFKTLKAVQKDITDHQGDQKYTYNKSLRDFYNDYASWTNSPIRWSRVYEEAIQKRDKIWKEIMRDYGEFIIEGYYEDDSQLDSYGLYLAAISQFAKRTHPNYTYSMKVVNWNLLTNYVPVSLSIGDIVGVKHSALGFYGSRNREVVLRIEIEKPEKFLSNWSFKYKKINEDYEDDDDDVHVETIVHHGRLKIIGNKYFIDFTIDIDATNYLIQWDKAILSVFSQLTTGVVKYARIKKIFVAHDSDNLEMSVTEITKDLRSGNIQLNLTNSFGMRNLVYKILKSSKYY